MVSDGAAIAAIAVMVLVTFATRVGGVWLMSHFTITPRIAAFLRSMGSSVLIAVVVPATVAGPPRYWLAAGASVAVMVATRNALWSMIAGAVAAGLARSFGA